MNQAKFCYPTPSHNPTLCMTIIRELESYDPSIFKAEFYAKGTDSIVFRLNRYVILKITRVDRNINLLREGKALFLINKMLGKSSFAPKMYSYTEHTVLEEFIEGKNLYELVVENRLDVETIAQMIKNAAHLDCLNIRHNELSRPNKHVIVREDGKPFFIDFASSTLGKGGNLPQLISALFLSKSTISKYVGKKLLINDEKKNEILNIIRDYKIMVKSETTCEKKVSQLLERLFDTIGIKIV
jgi:predicted Ser/Thr protein kinase